MHPVSFNNYYLVLSSLNHIIFILYIIKTIEISINNNLRSIILIVLLLQYYYFNSIIIAVLLY